MSKESESDRRGARRFFMELPVKVKLPSAGGPSTAATRTRDVSSRGLYFNVDWEVEVGSPIDFVLTLPQTITLSTDVRIHCVGRVVRVDDVPAGQANEKGAGGGIGVATIIEQYSFLPSDAEEPTT
ncbi:MAG TPA: PilZ domain-containing protein [Candidatus Acidoferrales bacterium]|nr:PilZ domain-containing protein [Candidatus Acidoferrales bacterium]